MSLDLNPKIERAESSEDKSIDPNGQYYFFDKSSHKYRKRRVKSLILIVDQVIEVIFSVFSFMFVDGISYCEKCDHGCSFSPRRDFKSFLCESFIVSC